MASAERIFQLLDIVPGLAVGYQAEEKLTISRAVTFDNVRFGYEAEQPILHGLSFKVQPGHSLAIVGPTGSGKSIIVNLLERCYDPDEGKILIDVHDIRSFDARRLRKQIGLVMQDVFIVPGSVRENILLDKKMAASKFDRIIQDAQLSGLVRQLPEGLKTQIGEGSMDLSAGQKQLLSLARVLARNPRILILDEATSSVDTETEILINRAIATTLVNRSSLVIAHRLSTIRRADNIMVIEQGKIVEQGSHETLLKNGGMYKRLLDLQINREATAG